MSRLSIVAVAALVLSGSPFYLYGQQHNDEAMHDLNASIVMTYAADEQAGRLVQAYALSKRSVTSNQLIPYTHNMLKAYSPILMGASGETALHIATRSHDQKFFEFILDARCSNKTHNDGNCPVCINERPNSAIVTPLHIAVQHGDYEKMQKLLDAGMNVNAKVYGDTPLDIAVTQGDINMMKLLREHKAVISDHRAQKLILQDLPNKIAVITLLDAWQMFGLFGTQKRHTKSLGNATLTGDIDLQSMFSDTPEWNELAYKLRCTDWATKLRQDVTDGRTKRLIRCKNADILDAVIPTDENARAWAHIAGGERALFELIIKQKNIPLLQQINKVSVLSLPEDARKGILMDELVEIIAQAASHKNTECLALFKEVLCERGCNSGTSALSHLIAQHDSQGVAMLMQHGASFNDLSPEEHRWIAPHVKKKLAQQSMAKICSYITHYYAGCAAHAMALVRGVDVQPLTAPNASCATGTLEQEMNLIKMEREILYTAYRDKGLHFMNARFAACYNNNTLEPVSFLEGIDDKSPELLDWGMGMPDCPSLLHTIASLGQVRLLAHVLGRSGTLSNNDKRVLVNVCAGPEAQTPLHRATGAVAAVRLLLEAGANETMQDAQGRTPLVVAIERKHENTVRFLLSRSESQKALRTIHYDMLAKLTLCGNIARVLLDKGLFKEAVDGWTAQDLAVLGNDNELLGLFMPKENAARNKAYCRACKRIANKLGFDYAFRKVHERKTEQDKHADVTVLKGAKNALHYLACCKNKKLLPKITAEKVLKEWMDEYHVSFTDLFSKCLSADNGNLLYGIALTKWENEETRKAYHDALAHLFLTCPLERIERLVRAKCDINARGCGESALRMAYCMQDAARIAALEKHGACLTESERYALWPICEEHLCAGIVKRFNQSLKNALGLQS